LSIRLVSFFFLNLLLLLFVVCVRSPGSLQQGRKKLNETIQTLHDQASAVDTKDIDTAIANLEKARLQIGAEGESEADKRCGRSDRVKVI
jgi:hypothetical protein